MKPTETPPTPGRPAPVPSSSAPSPPTATPSRISIIVPALDEAQTISETLRQLRSEAPHEILVVDGGSSDGTVVDAERHADRVIVQPGGLFAQLNRGAREAIGEILLFNYADTRLPEGALDATTRVLEDSRVVGGAFRLGFQADHPWFDLVAACGNLRNRLGFGPFGDQAIFVRRSTFLELGGFEPGAFLEDFELVRRLRRTGEFRILPLQVRTSIRRWSEAGFLKTTCLHWTMSAAYLLGKRRSGPVTRSWIRYLRSRRGRR